LGATGNPASSQQNLAARTRSEFFSVETINIVRVVIDHPCMGRSRLPSDLIAQLAAALGDKLDNLDDLEDAIEELKAEVGKSTWDTRLAQLPPEDGRPKKCPRCGRLVPVRNKRVRRRFESLSGTHTLVRNYHYCDPCQAGFCPRDLELGLPAEGAATLKLESRLLDFAVSGPYERSAERWCVHYPHRPFSANMLRRVAERVGRRLELARPEILHATLSPSPTGRQELLYVLSDGGLLLRRDGWKEAKVGVLVRGENYTSHRQRGRGHVSQARYVAVWGEQEEFKTLMRAALAAERWQRFDLIVWLGDGAKGNWTLAETLCPMAVQVLDPVHAVENGMTCGRVLLGEDSPLLSLWQRRVEQLVLSGDVDALVRELMECWLADPAIPELSDTQLAALDGVIGYYRNNQARMRYPDFLARGLMIGSGIVESAHRHVLQERMKLSGQRWSAHHGRRMVGLRAAYQTAGPRRFHHAINRAACVTHLEAERKRRSGLVTRSPDRHQTIAA